MADRDDRTAVGLVSVSSASEFVGEDELLARRLPLAGTMNLRDVGGYPTNDGSSIAWRRLLRADALHHLDDNGRKVLSELGLRTSIDLREPDERASAPDALDDNVRLVSIPFFSYLPPGPTPDVVEAIDRRTLTSLEETYRLLVHRRAPVLVTALHELVADGALPAVVHCTLGKDRTGVLIALVLGALGVPDEIIAADFAASALFLTEEYRVQAAARAAAAGNDPNRLRAMLQCDPELILGVLDELRTSYGGVVPYLDRHGFGDGEVVHLRELLLADGDDADRVA